MFTGMGRGDASKTNMHVVGHLKPSSEQSFILLSVGATIIGKTRQEEKNILDSILIKVLIDDKPTFECPGTLMATLFNMLTDKECAAFRAYLKESSESSESEGGFSQTNPSFGVRVGFPLSHPIAIGSDSKISVEIDALNDLREEIKLRVYLYGITSTDVQTKIGQPTGKN